MTIAGIEKEYLKLLQQRSIPTDERLSLSKGLLPDGTPTPPRVLARLFLDQSVLVREEAKKSILRLKEDALSQIASDNSTHSSLLLLLAKHFNDSPAVGTSIISNKNATEKILYYLQGRGDEVDDESDEEAYDRGAFFRDESLDNLEIGEEVEIEVSTEEEIVLEVPDEREKEETAPEFIPESYTDGDMEVVIELNEVEDFDDEEEILIGEDTVKAPGVGVLQGPPVTGEDIGIKIQDEGDQIIEDELPYERETTIEEERREFASAVDRIEGKVGEIFDIDLSDTRGGDTSKTEADGEGIEFEAVSGISGLEIPTDADTTHDFREPLDTEGWGPGEQQNKIDKDGMEISIASERFVTRLPIKKYVQKANPADFFVPAVKIFIPVAAVILVFFIFWVTLPKGEASVEEFDSGVNRILVETKMGGLNSKLKNPFPAGSYLSSWETGKAQKEKDFSFGDEVSGYRKLKNDLFNFKKKYTRELEYDEVSEKLDGKKKDLSRAVKRIKAIDKELSFLLNEKGEYLGRFSGENLKKNFVIEKRDKEISNFVKNYEENKSRIEKIEKDIADAKARIAEFERHNIPTPDDHGYYANKLEVEELTKEHGKMKPKFNRLESSYKGTLSAMEKKYKQQLDVIDRIEKIDKEVAKLNGERIQLDIEKRIYGEEIEELEKRIEKLEKAKATGEKITSKNLPVFLVMSNYINESERLREDRELNDDEEISFFEIYNIKQKDADLDITVEDKEGKEERNEYSTTFMRMITKKKILMFEWDVNTTKWVLTAISKKK